MLDLRLMAQDAEDLDIIAAHVQDAVMQVGGALEQFAVEAAQADDKLAAAVYAKAGAKVYELDEATVKQWQTLAREAAWKDYGARNENCGKLLAAAEKLL